ncbi:hypothetical protein TSUD_83720 [Trifolium subterraneum]|uniref:WAT1-related protein n=1 Tax=Trifolium subterraneum TaxID=3900 RepID=A0A2Z6N4P9_TRISU|nr:hypothetical protein TSUD_83720 [Trifolium subterraneum]
MKDIYNSLEGLKPIVLMVFVHIAYAAVNIIYKLVINEGMSMRVATAYRLTIASAFTIPLALLIFDRGSLFLNLYGVGLDLTSATFMLSISNLVPGITFIMAISSGLEKLNWGVVEGKVKVLGTLISIVGAMVGIVPSGLVIIVVAWCIKMRGPLFAAVFNPLQLLLVAIFAYLLVDEKLYLGSVLGAVLIVCGLYAVLWSKSKEMEKETQLLSLKTNIELKAEEIAMSNTEKCIQSNKTENNTIEINVTNDQL